MGYHAAVSEDGIRPLARARAEPEAAALREESETQAPGAFTRAWDLRNKTVEHMGMGERKDRGDKPPETPNG